MPQFHRTRRLPDTLKQHARQLRSGMTKQERRLWYDFFKKIPISARRQYIIGSYIADFYIPEARLVIELDGSQHFQAEGQEYDRKRDAVFRNRGLTVVRYANCDVDTQFDSVCEDILKRLGLR